MSKVQFVTRYSGLLSLICLTMVLSGCGDGRPSRVKVSGHVTVEGKPLEVGGISFYPIPEGRMGGGAIGKDGIYSTTMYKENDGLPPGSYAVAVNAVQIVNDTTQRWHAPKKYSDPETAGLTVEITEETDAMDIDLTWEGDDHSGPWVEKLR